MNTNRRHKTPWVRDKELQVAHSNNTGWIISICAVPQALIPKISVKMNWQYLYMGVWCYRRETLNLSTLTFIVNSKHSCCLLKRETLSVSYKTLL